MVATFARTSATVSQGGTSDLQGFQAHQPPTYMGGGDSMARTALAIEREVDDTWSIQGIDASAKRKEDQSSSSSKKKKKSYVCTDFKDKAAAIRAKAISRLLANQDR